MSKDEIISGWKASDALADRPHNAPDNPAGEVSLSNEDLDSVAGGMVADTLSCTGDNTVCHGTCGVPFLTYGCCS